MNGNSRVLKFYPLNNSIYWEVFRNDVPALNRHGFFGILYRKQILIFGGEKGKNVGVSMRNLSNSLLIYEPERN